jgi:uncharacterized protein
MSAPWGPGRRTRVRRQPQFARYDEATVASILDATPFCVVAGVLDGRAVALPMVHLREGRRLYLHASASNALLRALLEVGEACVTVVLYDGLRLARSGFESSVAYRSVVCFGSVRAVDDDVAARVLDALVERTVPGRLAEVRPATTSERQRTLVVAFDIDEASAKVSAGPTDDDPADAARAIWSGVVPVRSEFGAPIGSFDGAMAGGDVAVAPSVGLLVGRASHEAVTRLVAQVRAIDPVNAREAASIAALLDRLTWSIDPFSEAADPRHVTASAFVVSARGVILHQHRQLGIWVQPGGHVDPGERPEDAAVREVLEETGLVTHHLGSGEVFHVDVHQGPRGHTHYDLRYVLVAPPDDPVPGEDESPDVFWFDIAAAKERCEAGLVPAIDKLGRALSRWNVQD